MAKGGSSADTSVSTTTNTTIRDIGLTGQNVADVIAVIEAGAVEQEKIASTNLSTLTAFADTQAARSYNLSLSTPDTQPVSAKLAPYIIAAAAVIGAFAFVRR